MANSEPLKKGHKANFATLKRAANNGDLALLSCRDKATGKSVAVICAAQWREGEYVFVPFAKLFDGDPYDEIEPPVPDEPQGETP